MLLTFSRFILVLFYSIIILEAPAVWSSDLEKIQKIENSTSLKDIKFFDFSNNPTDIVDKETDFYIVNFWASWCAPCIKEMKSLDRLKSKMPSIKVITVSQDADIMDAIEFFKKNSYNNLENYFDFNKTVSKHFSLRGLPTTFIFNNSLISFAKVEGIIEWNSYKFTEWLKSQKNSSSSP